MSHNCCFNCRVQFGENQLYQCLTCSDAKEMPTPTELCCAECVSVLHIKKQHEVQDMKGYEPDICAIHSALCLMYCRTCDQTFCYGCLADHFKHEFLTANQISTEVKKEIWELFGALDSVEKPARKKLEAIRECLNVSRQETNKKCQLVEKYFDDAKHKLLREMRKSMKPIEEAQKELELNVENIGQYQKELRELLMQSDVVRLHNFAKVRNGLKSLIDDQAQINLRAIDEAKINAKQSSAAFSAARELKQKLGCSVFHKMLSASIFVDVTDERSEAYEFYFEKGSLNMNCWLRNDKTGGLEFVSRVKSWKISKNVSCIEKVYEVHGGFVLLFDSETAFFWKVWFGGSLELITYPSYLFICPYVYLRNGRYAVGWVYCDDNQMVLKFTHRDDEQIPFRKQPRCLGFSRSCSSMVFEIDKNSVAVVRYKFCHSSIPFTTTYFDHNLDQVDHATSEWFDCLVLVLWNKSTQNALVAEFDHSHSAIRGKLCSWTFDRPFVEYQERTFMVPCACFANNQEGLPVTEDQIISN